jgi:hypothetical protein
VLVRVELLLYWFIMQLCLFAVQSVGLGGRRWQRLLVFEHAAGVVCQAVQVQGVQEGVPVRVAACCYCAHASNHWCRGVCVVVVCFCACLYMLLVQVQQCLVWFWCVARPWPAIGRWATPVAHSTAGAK